MLYTALLHTHTTLIGIYVLIFLIKLILLLASRYEQLARFRKRTRVIGEMIIPVLFLGTGIYLAINSPYASQPWFIAKIIAIILAVILGIITFRKNSKVLGIVTLLIFAYIIALSYTKTPQLVPQQKELAKKANSGDTFDPNAPGYDALAHGAYLYQTMGCVGCHGVDGAAGLAGAANLQISMLDSTGLQNVIRNGRKTMPPFGNSLSDVQIKALAEYVQKHLRR
jgi:mono/diheme cytochrome c family protein